MAQDNTVMTLSSLRNDRTFATISQFFHTFQSAYQPWPNYADSHWASILQRPLSNRLKNSTAQDDYVFATEDLEDMLMDSSRRYQLEELIIRMLRLLTRNRFISASTWQEYFFREWERREPDQANPFHVVENNPSADLTAKSPTTNDQANVTQSETMSTNSDEKKSRSFFDLPMETRLILLNALCEWQLDDPERLREQMANEEDATQWRVDPIGYDKKGNTFWLFDDNRLYKETAPLNKKKMTNRKKKKPMPPPSTRRSVRRSTRNTNTNTSNLSENPDEEEDEEDDEEWTPWKLVCMTVDEWQRFPLQYSKSNHPQDQQFHQLLIDDVLPKVIPVIEEHEKDRKKQEAITYRKRSSRILVRELEALEQHQAASNEISSQQQVSLSRNEQKRLQKEAEEKERQAKARQERILERERKVFEKAQAEERAVERARLDRERRLQRRHGGDTYIDIDIDGDEDVMMEQDESLQQQQGFKLILTVADPKKKSTVVKKSKTKVAKGDKTKNKKEAGDPMLGKRKRGRKPKVRLQEDDEIWTFNCTCGIFGKNIDDGTPMIACERCDEWQHIDCLRRSGQVDTQLTTFDDLTFICRRCIEKETKEHINVDDANTVNEAMINTKIQKAMPTPPDTYKQPSLLSNYTTVTVTDTALRYDSSHHSPTGHQNNSPLAGSTYQNMTQSCERHFLQQPSRSPYQSSSYLPLKQGYPSQFPYAEMNGDSNSSSFERRPMSENQHHHQHDNHNQLQQQSTLPSLSHHYSRLPIQLNPLQASHLSSPSSSSMTTKNTIAPPPPISSTTNIGNAEATHKIVPTLNNIDHNSSSNQ